MDSCGWVLDECEKLKYYVLFIWKYACSLMFFPIKISVVWSHIIMHPATFDTHFTKYEKFWHIIFQCIYYLCLYAVISVKIQTQQILWLLHLSPWADREAHAWCKLKLLKLLKSCRGGFLFVLFSLVNKQHSYGR